MSPSRAEFTSRPISSAGDGLRLPGEGGVAGDSASRSTGAATSPPTRPAMRRHCRRCSPAATCGAASRWSSGRSAKAAMRGRDRRDADGGDGAAAVVDERGSRIASPLAGEGGAAADQRLPARGECEGEPLDDADTRATALHSRAILPNRLEADEGVADFSHKPNLLPGLISAELFEGDQRAEFFGVQFRVAGADIFARTKYGTAARKRSSTPPTSRRSRSRRW